MTIILGIDPGSNLLGYAFLAVPASGKPQVLAMDTLDLRSEEDHPAKLKQIFESLQVLIDEYKPTSAAIEAPFYGKDAQAMLKLGRAQGVAMVAMACKGLTAIEYSPRSVKKAVTGNGNAAKEQVAGMLPHLVEGIRETRFLDASDALGIAYCHYLQTNSRLGGGGKKYSGWASFLNEQKDRIL